MYLTYLPIVAMGFGGGTVVSVLSFNSYNPSLNPAEVYIFSVKYCLKRTKINKKRPGGRIFQNNCVLRERKLFNDITSRLKQNINKSEE